MSAGSQLLNQGWATLLDHHATQVTYIPKVGGQMILSPVLVSKPSDLATFGRNSLGVSFILFATQGQAPYAVHDEVVMDGVTYKVLQVERQPADISIRLMLGITETAGRQ
jgi:hypothetical protein